MFAPIALLIGVFVWWMTFNRDEAFPLWRRVLASLLFGLAAFVFSFGAVAAYIFRDGLFSESHTEGWPAVMRYGRTFLPGAIISSLCVIAGFAARNFKARTKLT